MTTPPDLIADLTARVDHLQKSLTRVLADATAAQELVFALAIQAPNRAQLLADFNHISQRFDADLIYSTASEESLEQLEQARNGIREQLQPPGKTP